MGKAVQAEDYVIVFTASWETFEDTLLFFHNDFQEAVLREPGRPCGSGRAVGVHVSHLDDALSFHEYGVIQNDALRRLRSREAIRPALVHLLHFAEENEIAMHRRLAQRMDTAGIALVNPYSDTVAHSDSKFRMSEILREHRVPTPATHFVSRFTEDKTGAVERTRRQWPQKDVYVQPDRGTEATGCVLLKRAAKEDLPVAQLAKSFGVQPKVKATSATEGMNSSAARLSRNEPTLKQSWECNSKQDLIVRERVGNLTYDGHDFVLRINVTHDGKTFSADSGYCMVGDHVVSAAHGAVKENVNRVLDQLGLQQEEIGRIQATACAALRAVSTSSVPPRLAGVDLVLEKNDLLTAYVIDINPRPVAVGSRMIGSNAIGLGDHFWSGIRDLQLTLKSDQAVTQNKLTLS